MDFGNAGTLLAVGAALVIGILLVKKFELEVNTDFEVNEKTYDIDLEFEFEREKERKKKNGKKNKSSKADPSPKEQMNNEMEYQSAKDTTADVNGPYDELIMPTL